ncbi:MAG: SRPBCC family protein [Micrococcales bacterium]|nr:SRPBCC family protein [Micrococcales bacterium]
MTNPVSITAPEGLPFIEIEREFDAPRAAVLEAHRDPELVRRWLGPRGYEMEIHDWDLRTGGRYRYTHHSPDHGSFAFFGSFHSVSPELLIQTFEFEGVPGVASIETMRLEALGDGTRTRATIHAVYPSLQARDGMIENGMESGVVEGYEKLDEVLARETTPTD